jgi:hypothetical protein
LQFTKRTHRFILTHHRVVPRMLALIHRR